jgi:hypothetical protein
MAKYGRGLPGSGAKVCDHFVNVSFGPLSFVAIVATPENFDPVGVEVRHFCLLISLIPNKKAASMVRHDSRGMDLQNRLALRALGFIYGNFGHAAILTYPLSGPAPSGTPSRMSHASPDANIAFARPSVTAIRAHRQLNPSIGLYRSQSGQSTGAKPLSSFA